MACIVCNIPTASQCGKCHMVRYCGREHQLVHFESHKSCCKAYVAAVKKVEKEEAILRRGVSDWFGGTYNPFDEEYIGRFWGLHETRDYMRARNGVIMRLDDIATPEATVAALDHSMDCLRLCRSDNTGVREYVVSYLIILGRDQECYDFIKWYETMGSDDHYDWGNMSLPFLNLKNENRYEALLPNFLRDRFGPSISFISAMILIKFRLLYNMQQNVNSVTALLLGTHARLGANSNVIKLAGKEQVLTHIASYLFPESVSDPLHVFTIIPPILRDLRHQVQTLMNSAARHHPELFYSILDPEPVLRMPAPASYGYGSIEEVQIYLKNIVRSWESVPGALDMLDEEAETGWD